MKRPSQPRRWPRLSTQPAGGRQEDGCGEGAAAPTRRAAAPASAPSAPRTTAARPTVRRAHGREDQRRHHHRTSWREPSSRVVATSSAPTLRRVAQEQGRGAEARAQEGGGGDEGQTEVIARWRESGSPGAATNARGDGASRRIVGLQPSKITAPTSSPRSRGTPTWPGARRARRRRLAAAGEGQDAVGVEVRVVGRSALDAGEDHRCPLGRLAKSRRTQRGEVRAAAASRASVEAALARQRWPATALRPTRGPTRMQGPSGAEQQTAAAVGQRRFGRRAWWPCALTRVRSFGPVTWLR